MELEKTCPVCGLVLDSTGVSTCPQCDADLTCFQVLDTLPDELPAPIPIPQVVETPLEPQPGRRGLPYGLALLGAGLVTGVILALWVVPEPPPVAMAPPEVFPLRMKVPVAPVEASREPIEKGLLPGEVSMEDVQAAEAEDLSPAEEESLPREERTLPEILSQIAASERPLSKEQAEQIQDDRAADIDEGEPEEALEVPSAAQVSHPTEEAFDPYRVAARDTLWSISEKVYGTGFHFPVLMETNPGLGVYNLEEDMVIWVFKDPQAAKELYEGIIEIKGPRVYYGYQVVPGDTLKGIARKFYGPSAMETRIMELNPGGMQEAGERIKVELE